jgi:hypothetical protein
MDFFASQDNRKPSYFPSPYRTGQVAQSFIQDIPKKKQQGIEGLVLC